MTAPGPVPSAWPALRSALLANLRPRGADRDRVLLAFERPRGRRYVYIHRKTVVTDGAETIDVEALLDGKERPPPGKDVLQRDGVQVLRRRLAAGETDYESARRIIDEVAAAADELAGGLRAEPFHHFAE